MSQKRVFVPQKIITKINLRQVTVHFVLKHAEVLRDHVILLSESLGFICFFLLPPNCYKETLVVIFHLNLNPQSAFSPQLQHP